MSSIVSDIGPFYVGVLLNIAIGGVNWMQLLDYLTRAPQDRPLVRFAVLSVFLVSAVHTAVSCHITWFYGIEHFGDEARLADCVWSFAVDPLLTALVAAFVQSHYAWRVYLVGKRSAWAPGVILVLTALQLGLGIYLTVIALVDTAWVNIHRRLDAYVATWLFTMAAGDIAITGALTYHLNQVRSEFDTTKSLVDRIVRTIVANNALTAVSAIASGILFVSSRNTGWHVIFGITLARLYTLSFLSSLNARQSLRSDLARRLTGASPPGPKPLRLSPRGCDGSPDSARLPTETTSASRLTHLFVRPGLGRTGSAVSGASSGGFSWREKRREEPRFEGEPGRGLGVDSMPITIQIESEVADDSQHPSEPALLPGDSWNPSRFYSNPSPSPSLHDHSERGDAVLDMTFLHAIEVSMDQGDNAKVDY
ncbi:hypothetical protein DMC30DRAFT_417367 [Rhodotorula diobovata]|uniref:DUF6534 domain-containing protein n=1 Tax=Rhodotorula diobovata TaxID=5288 RepID=A0A5C5FTA4_9BASI|nr:hypothetical protein DMC30DRAFT_417367 [Rhodotorula diobovata]